ncbi:32_5-bisphosphate nucleotidase 1, partial [Caligus rogercresseyi]
HYFDEALAQRHVVNLSESNTEYTLPKESLGWHEGIADGFLERVTILIGIAVKGKSVAGVIHQPYYKETEGRTLYGAIGGSIDKNFEKKPSPSEGKNHCHDSKPFHKACRTSWRSWLQGSNAPRWTCSCYVFPTPGCKKWDTCAPEAIYMHLEAVKRNIWGHSYNYDAQVEHVNQWGVIASCRDSDHENLISQSRRI